MAGIVLVGIVFELRKRHEPLGTGLVEGDEQSKGLHPDDPPAKARAEVISQIKGDHPLERPALAFHRPSLGHREMAPESLELVHGKRR